MIRWRSRGFRNGSTNPPGRGGKLVASLFFLAFFSAGSLFEVLLVRDFSRALGQRGWKEVSCRIIRSEVEERNDSQSPYAFAVRYEYALDGQTRAGTAYQRRYQGSEKYSDVQKLVEKYPVGQNASCYVNPKNPAETVLKRDSLLMGLVFFFPLIFVVVGAGGLYFIWRKVPPDRAQSITVPITRRGNRSKYGIAAFFAIFAGVGLAVLYPLGIRPVAKTLAARSWAEVPCRILRTDVRSHSSDDGTTYSIHILYSYNVDGQTYKSDRYDFIGGSSSGYQGKARVVAQYEAMPNPTCYVDPDDPSEAVLKRGFHAKLLLALFPMPFILVGLGGMYFTLRRKKGAASGAKSWLPKTPPRKASDDIAILHQVEARPVVLKAKYSPCKKLIGVIVIALIWNSIVSVMLAEVVQGFRQGDPRWGMTLFAVPFVAVGVGLLLGIVYQALAAFNPRPTLELSSATIPLGGAVELDWCFSGRTNRIREFAVTLRGIEQATYRRGTDTRTDTHMFYQMELYKTSDPENIATGQVGLVVPQETMHSFEADNNKILWHLDVHGDIKRWPDVKESFKITVVPAAV